LPEAGRFIESSLSYRVGWKLQGRKKKQARLMEIDASPLFPLGECLTDWHTHARVLAHRAAHRTVYKL